MISDDVVANMQPRLVEHAELELRRLGLRVSDAEDVVQDAWVELLEARRPRDMERWLRACIDKLVVDAHRRRLGDPRGGKPDPLDMDPVSLDALAEREFGAA